MTMPGRVNHPQRQRKFEVGHDAGPFALRLVRPVVDAGAAVEFIRIDIESLSAPINRDAV
ncbi:MULTISPECIES: hypothetical protein [unclassified Shinella]|uniref:hypothetical protein n=1 Tax=unclassified Shinella TaxID=2643062 RepID=UPI00234E7E31|nr:MULTISPECIES: hypothetical protein [unclassified Shinella]MCO5137554.1 hypothetical protein [Shinella sp.]MDC7257672.1 hypothetical protein [Shinella sp. YE25]